MNAAIAYSDSHKRALHFIKCTRLMREALAQLPASLPERNMLESMLASDMLRARQYARSELNAKLSYLTNVA